MLHDSKYSLSLIPSCYRRRSGLQNFILVHVHVSGSMVVLPIIMMTPITWNCPYIWYGSEGYCLFICKNTQEVQLAETRRVAESLKNFSISSPPPPPPPPPPPLFDTCNSQTKTDKHTTNLHLQLAYCFFIQQKDTRKGESIHKEGSLVLECHDMALAGMPIAT